MKIPPPTRSEHVEQREFISWFRQTFNDVKIFAIPNGGARSKSVALQMKLEGVLPGVPDLCIPKWHLWIEMKKVGGHLEDNQRDMIGYLVRECGDNALVCYGFEDAKENVLRFVRLMGCADKQHLLSERKELQRFLQEIPSDHVIDRMSIQSRLDAVNLRMLILLEEGNGGGQRRGAAMSS